MCNVCQEQDPLSTVFNCETENEPKQRTNDVAMFSVAKDFLTLVFLSFSLLSLASISTQNKLADIISLNTMFSTRQTFLVAALAFLATSSYQVEANGVMFNETDDFYNGTDDFYNGTEMDGLEEYEMDIDCTCDDSGISCSVPADEEACACEDGDVVCVDMPMVPVDAPSAMAENEPLEPDMGIAGDDSGAYSLGSVAMAVLAAGVVAAAM